MYFLFLFFPQVLWMDGFNTFHKVPMWYFFLNKNDIITRRESDKCLYFIQWTDKKQVLKFFNNFIITLINALSISIAPPPSQVLWMGGFNMFHKVPNVVFLSRQKWHYHLKRKWCYIWLYFLEWTDRSNC